MKRPGSFLPTLSAFNAYTVQPNTPFVIAPIIASRFFQSEAEFHPVADETLDVIQDVMDEIFRDIGGDEEDMEVSVASGVLTMSLPPHGTWVINKQTPNRQLWWSSPISGPRRYEYENGKWVYTRSGEGPTTLGATLAKEINELYDLDLEIDI
jgi:frataxin